MRCVVCGSIGSTRYVELMSGARLGPACVGECEGLAWEQHFQQATGATAYDRAELAWRWRRRIAAVEGRAFLEAPPKGPGEIALDRVIAANGWTAIAKELE